MNVDLSTKKKIIQFSNVSRVYQLGKTLVTAVNEVSFNLYEGDFISIIGPSGSGKTTTLNMIGVIDTPSKGTISIDGLSTESLSDNQVSDLRHQKIGFIFQSFNLVPVLNVYENVEFPLLIGHKKKKVDKEYLDFLLDEVGLSNYKHHKANELSGGQRQRVAIARALSGKPLIVLADEPTANLDSKTGDQIIELMKKINNDLGTTFVFSTHDAKIVSQADHVIKLLDGQIIENNYIQEIQ